MPGHEDGRPRRSRIGLVFDLAVGALTLRWRRYEIAERSMLPTLPPGAWTLGVARPRHVAVGDIVVARMPGRADFDIVKRVAAIDPTDGSLWLAGDAPGEGSVDSGTFGSVPPDAIAARLVLVYRPRPVRRLR